MKRKKKESEEKEQNTYKIKQSGIDVREFPGKARFLFPNSLVQTKRRSLTYIYVLAIFAQARIQPPGVERRS
jgi:hypothetical protein